MGFSAARAGEETRTPPKASAAAKNLMRWNTLNSFDREMPALRQVRAHSEAMCEHI